jgi:hypothetical protein
MKLPDAPNSSHLDLKIMSASAPTKALEDPAVAAAFALGMQTAKGKLQMPFLQERTVY